MRTAFLQFHRAVKVPPSIANYGVALPGHDTPAAGWLLPKAEFVTSIRDGVADGVGIYRHPLVKLSPGKTYSLRKHPWPSTRCEHGLFAEYETDAGVNLTYLALTLESMPNL